MNDTDIALMWRDGMLVMLKLGGPPLVVALVVGLLVALLRGSLRMATGLIGKTHPEAVHVETPTAVIGIRGTDFIVETDSQQ